MTMRPGIRAITIICVLGLLLGALFVIADRTVTADQSGDYTYTTDGVHATITKYTGSGTDISIPSALGGSQVVAIGDNAFYNCYTLTSVIIPDSVATIGDSAFQYCTHMTSVTIGNGVTIIGGNAFQSCHLLTSVNIGPGVTSIGYTAFNECEALTAINIDPGNLNYASSDGVLYNHDRTILIAYPAGER